MKSSFLSRSRGFSLIEVVLALGIVSFALMAIVGMLPVALTTQRDAVNQAFAVQALNDVSQALRGAYRLTPVGPYKFPAPLPTSMTAGSGTQTLTLSEDGLLTTGGDTNALEAKGVVRIEQKAVIAASIQPVFISVAWPASAVRQGNKWVNAQGSVDAFVYLNLP
jgi:prepilin-type N-terminal cleavage/methylation domain-containing protein